MCLGLAEDTCSLWGEAQPKQLSEQLELHVLLIINSSRTVFQGIARI